MQREKDWKWGRQKTYTVLQEEDKSMTSFDLDRREQETDRLKRAVILLRPIWGLLLKGCLLLLDWWKMQRAEHPSLIPHRLWHCCPELIPLVHVWWREAIWLVFSSTQKDNWGQECKNLTELKLLPWRLVQNSEIFIQCNTEE